MGANPAGQRRKMRLKRRRKHEQRLAIKQTPWPMLWPPLADYPELRSEWISFANEYIKDAFANLGVPEWIFRPPTTGG